MAPEYVGFGEACRVQLHAIGSTIGNCEVTSLLPSWRGDVELCLFNRMRLPCRGGEETKLMRRNTGREIPREEPFPNAMTTEVMLPSQVCATRSLEEKAPITVLTVVRRLLATAACVL